MVAPIRIPRAISVAAAEPTTVPRPLRRGKAGLARMLMSLGLAARRVPTVCGELCFAPGVSVLEPALNGLKRPEIVALLRNAGRRRRARPSVCRDRRSRLVMRLAFSFRATTNATAQVRSWPTPGIQNRVAQANE